MKIQSAIFLKSSSKVSECPKSSLKEFAFIGRSNVGKSSLINALTFQKNLAKTSQTPGKTQLINHFLINNQWHLVDLPGYGYARVSKEQRGQFERMIMDYLTQRESLTCLFVLVDIRLPAQPIDLEFMSRMAQAAVPFHIVFTKADKISKTQAALQVDAYQKTMLETWESLPNMFVTSAAKNQGREEILENIEELLSN